MSGCDHPGACRASLFGYMEGCRGECCVDAQRVYRREQKRRLRRPDVTPQPARVHVGQLRTHLEELRAGGIGCAQVARVSGVREATVWRIATGRQATVTPETKEALLAVMGSMLAPNALVGAGPTLERLEDLTFAGWSDVGLAREIFGATVKAGQGPWRMRELRAASGVRFRTADAVAALHAEEFPPVSEGADPLADWLLDQGDQGWRELAECRRIDPEPKVRHAVFFPTRGEPATQAREVCGRCPVQVECLDYALKANPPGIWGETTGGDRRLIRRLGWTAADVAAARSECPEVPLIDLLRSALGAAVA